MLFSPGQIKRVLDGRRTLLLVPADRQRYRTGRKYSVNAMHARKGAPPRQGPQVARVKVVSIRAGLLHEVDFRTARAAGFKNRLDLFDYWRGRYGIGPGTADHPVEVPLAVVRFELEREVPPRFLRPTAGYTDNPAQAIPDEPECVPAAYQREISRVARQRDGLLRGPVRPGAPADWQRLKREAARLGVDVSRDEAAIRRRLDAMARKVQAAA